MERYIVQAATTAERETIKQIIVPEKESCMLQQDCI